MPDLLIVALLVMAFFGAQVAVLCFYLLEARHLLRQARLILGDAIHLAIMLEALAVEEDEDIFRMDG